PSCGHLTVRGARIRASEPACARSGSAGRPHDLRERPAERADHRDRHRQQRDRVRAEPHAIGPPDVGAERDRRAAASPAAAVFLGVARAEPVGHERNRHKFDAVDGLLLADGELDAAVGDAGRELLGEPFLTRCLRHGSTLRALRRGVDSLLGNDDPEHDVDEPGRAGEERRDDRQAPGEGEIPAEATRDPGAHAGDDAALAGADEGCGCAAHASMMARGPLPRHPENPRPRGALPRARLARAGRLDTTPRRAPMAELTDTDRVAVYIDFDNIVISRYDQLHGDGAWRKNNARDAKPATAEKLAAARVDVSAVLDYASSFGTVAVTRAYADWSVPANAAYRAQLV